MLHTDCESLVLSQEQIAARVRELGAQISADYAGGEIRFISILNGAFIFTADLLREISVKCEVDFMQVSSYGDSTCSSGTLKIKRDISMQIENTDVVIVEDILDTGYTMRNLLNYLHSKNPRSIRVCTLIDKPARRTEDVHAYYSGFTFDEDLFLVGYGLDYAQKYRNLPYVAVLKPEIYS